MQHAKTLEGGGCIVILSGRLLNIQTGAFIGNNKKQVDLEMLQLWHPLSSQIGTKPRSGHEKTRQIWRIW